ncbi:FtsH protease activity modulator HflK [Myxococcota bacterium]|nr:FtsH protease activity modulator HflK [Myxococcota bacterium]
MNTHSNGHAREPSPEEVWRDLKARLSGPNRGPFVTVVALLVGGGVIWSSYYQVEPDEVAVVQRLGRYAGTSGPGPHFKLPFGIDEIVKVPVQRQLKLEFGFRSGIDPRVASSDATGRALARESMMLTGDLNVAVVEWTVQYQIRDPAQYLFKVRNVESTMRDLAEAATRIVVGDHSVNEVLTTGREKIADAVKEQLQALATRYETGVEVQQVVLQDVNPPDQVKPSFNEVNQAIQEKERAINEAHAERNQVVPRARGEAEQAIKAAEGYAIERVNRAQGESHRFLQLYAEYQRNPDVMRRRLYVETMSEILPKAGQKVLIDEGGVTPLLRLDLPGQSASSGATATKVLAGGVQ